MDPRTPPDVPSLGDKRAGAVRARNISPGITARTERYLRASISTPMVSGSDMSQSSRDAGMTRGSNIKQSEGIAGDKAGTSAGAVEMKEGTKRSRSTPLTLSQFIRPNSDNENSSSYQASAGRTYSMPPVHIKTIIDFNIEFFRFN